MAKFDARKLERQVKKVVEKKVKEANKDLDKLAKKADGKSQATVERELKKTFDKHGFEVDKKTLRGQAKRIAEE